MTMTYTRCSACNGMLKLLPCHSTGGIVVPCPCTRSSTPGWSPTGVTERQLEGLVQNHETLQALLFGTLAVAIGRLTELRGEKRERGDRVMAAPLDQSGQ